MLTAMEKRARSVFLKPRVMEEIKKARKSNREIMQEFGIVSSTVKSWAEEAGVKLPRHKPARYSQHDWSEIDPLLGKFTDRDLAEHFEAPPDTIRHRRLKFGIDAVPRSVFMGQEYKKRAKKELTLGGSSKYPNRAVKAYWKQNIETQRLLDKWKRPCF